MKPLSVEFKRLDAWIHWKKLELAKYPSEDEELFLNEIVAVRNKSKQLEELELRFQAVRNLLLESNKDGFSIDQERTDQEIAEEVKRLGKGNK